MYILTRMNSFISWMNSSWTTCPLVIKPKQQDLTLNTFDTPLCNLWPHLFRLLKRTKRLTLECPVACHQLAKVSAAALGITIQEMVYHVVCRYLAEKAESDPQMKAIRESVLGNAAIDELPNDICTFGQREELINATTHKLPWE